MTWQSIRVPTGPVNWAGVATSAAGRNSHQPTPPSSNSSSKRARAAIFQLVLRFGRAWSSPSQLGQRGLLPGRRTNSRLQSGSVQTTEGAGSWSSRS